MEEEKKEKVEKIQDTSETQDWGVERNWEEEDTERR